MRGRLHESDRIHAGVAKWRGSDAFDEELRWAARLLPRRIIGPRNPMLDDRTAVDPAAADLPVRLWENVANRFGWTCYLGEPPGGPGVSALAAPGRATDLSGLPPAWIGVGTRDLFHDECLSCADRLRASGVPCELHVSPGAFHGSDVVVAKAGVSRRFIESRRHALARALDAASPS